MLKLCGALLIVVSCGLSGRIFNRALLCRVRQLSTLRQGLSLLTTEISYGFTPLPQALSKVGRACQGEIGQLFFAVGSALQRSAGCSAEEIWHDCVTQNRAQLSFNEDDLELLYSVGVGLGHSDCTDQLRRLQLAAELCETQIEQARTESARMGKVWQTLGWGTGIMLALLWI